MKAIMVMFDTLNRRMLPPYGCDWVHAPNFRRLAEKTVVFDSCFVGSMPCMPARRELHTGRYNFLHRSWGPLEPFDDSMPRLLRLSGIHTHLATDHQHYWEEGGCTYHNQYSTYELVRGQEGDPWKGETGDPEMPEMHRQSGKSPFVRQDWINRRYIREEAEFPQARTFANGLEFIRNNHQEDRWFLQIETFDPHEPFHTPERYKELYPHVYNGAHFDWPPYAQAEETDDQIRHIRCEYAALVSMCDTYLGKVLDLMDTLDLWKDTMLIVNTDHGFMLGEHDWWGKCRQPFYNEVAHIPLFIWDPRCGCRGERRNSLVQTIDLAPTLLDFFQVDIPPNMQGQPLGDTIASDKPVREAALFGIHGGHVNCTDGRYVYMRAPVSPDNQPLYNYTLMPTHMRGFFRAEELHSMELAEPFSFTKGIKTMKVRASASREFHHFGTLLFDINNDPEQLTPLKDNNTEALMISRMIRLMQENDAPAEQFQRLDLPLHAQCDHPGRS